MSAKITTLIPAFRHQYLDSVFRGLCNQNFNDFEIIIVDDSPEKIVSHYISGGAYANYTDRLNIKLFSGAGSERDSHNLLLQMWGGSSDLAHIHHDDDYILPDFYRMHVNAHFNMQASITVSSRWLAGIDGIPKYYSSLPLEIDQQNERYTLLSPSFVAGTTLVPVRNWLGEFSSMVLSKRVLDFAHPIPDFGEPYGGILDMSMFLRNALHGFDVGYIRDHLSVYRMQPPSAHYHDPNLLSGVFHRLWWVASAVQAWRDRLLDNASLLESINNFLKRYLSESPENLSYCKLSDAVNSSSNDLLSLARQIDEIIREVMSPNR